MIAVSTCVQYLVGTLVMAGPFMSVAGLSSSSKHATLLAVIPLLPWIQWVDASILIQARATITVTSLNASSSPLGCKLVTGHLHRAAMVVHFA